VIISHFEEHFKLFLEKSEILAIMYLMPHSHPQMKKCVLVTRRST
jgi:hypothetical protein